MRVRGILTTSKNQKQHRTNTISTLKSRRKSSISQRSCIATLTNCGDTLRIAAASVGNIRPISILFPPVGGSLGLFIPSTSFPAMYTVLMLFTLKIIENLLTIHALSSRCDRYHVSHGIAARCLSACHRQSVGCHPDTDGATAAPFRL